VEKIIAMIDVTILEEMFGGINDSCIESVVHKKKKLLTSGKIKMSKM
jgi:hypothetical protein